MIPGSTNLLLAGAQQGYQISRSLRFNSADSAYLERTTGGTAGNQKTWTFSCWVKRSKLGTLQWIFSPSVGGDGTNESAFSFQATDKIRIYDSGATRGDFITTQVFRDTSAWYHIVVVLDTTQGTSTDRFKLYVNGVQVTTFDTASYPGPSTDWGWNRASTRHRIGAYAYPSTATYFGDFYLAEIHHVDGQALTPSSFGETDTITGVWKPKKVTGVTYGTNGFYLNFSDNSGITATTLGKDSSSNGNNWTPSATFSVTPGTGNDSLVDSPTLYGIDTGAGGEVRGNYATFSATLASAFFGGATLKNGNLQVQGVGGVANTYARGTMAILGKAYAEFYFDVVTSPASVGVVPINDTATDGALYVRSTNVSYRAGGNKRVLGTESAYGASWVANDIIGVAVDPTANTVEFFKNGTSQGVITSSSFFAQGNCTFAVATDDVGSPQGYANFGQRPFAYTAPSGFKALCTTNLPEPTLVKGSSYMDTLLYTGNSATSSAGTTARTLSGLGFAPDLIWVKSRNNGGTWSDHSLTDSVRGANLSLSTNTTGSETNVATGFSNGGVGAPTSDGFTIVSGTAGSTANLNSSSGTYAAWCWDAGSSTVTNTSGSISSQVRANASAGFSVVSWTYDGSTNPVTIGHGLNTIPAFIILKQRAATTDWYVYHKNLTSAAYTLSLNTAAGQSANSDFGNTAPTSSVFSCSTTGVTGRTLIAYCFAEVAGYSAFGSYVGNGSTSDGPFIFLNFKPRWILVKWYKDVSSAESWMIYDTARGTYNATNTVLYPDSSTTEESPADRYIDILSNGFKPRQNGQQMNRSGASYIYAAFAENPFKYSLAR